MAAAAEFEEITRMRAADHSSPVITRRRGGKIEPYTIIIMVATCHNNEDVVVSFDN
jgi:hypothetical protein